MELNINTLASMVKELEPIELTIDCILGVPGITYSLDLTRQGLGFKPYSVEYLATHSSIKSLIKECQIDVHPFCKDVDIDSMGSTECFNYMFTVRLEGILFKAHIYSEPVRLAETQEIKESLVLRLTKIESEPLKIADVMGDS